MTLKEIIIAVVIVTGSFYGGTGPVAAQPTCSELEEFFWVLSIGLTNDHCDPTNLTQRIENLREGQAEVTEVNLYNAAVAQKEQSDAFRATMSNQLQDIRSVAFSKAEAAAIEAFQAGKSRDDAYSDARRAIDEYYSVRQANIIASWNAAMAAWWYGYNTSRADGDIDQNFNRAGGWANKFSKGTSTYTLFNGSVVETVTIKGKESWEGRHFRTYWHWGILDIAGYESGGEFWGGLRTGPFDLAAKPPREGYSSVTVLKSSAYYQLLERLTADRQQVYDNAVTYVDSVYDAMAAGEVDPSTAISSNTLAQEYATAYNETGYYVYAVAALSSAGYATANLSQTDLMTVEADGRSYQGLLMSQTAPESGRWETGIRYDAAAIPDTQMVITTDGHRVPLDGEFTIARMEDRNGNRLNSTRVQDYVYETANASDYARLQEELQALRREVSERASAGSGGSGSGDRPFGLSNVELLVVLGVLALAAFSASQRGGGGMGGRSTNTRSRQPTRRRKRGR